MLKKVYNIRPAKERDLPFLPKLEERATLLDAYNLPPHWMSEQARPNASAFLEAVRNNTLWVAERRGNLAGLALATPLDGVPLLCEVGVLPEEGVQGLDDALVSAVLRRAAEKGYQRLWTTAFGSLSGAQTLYGRRGFKPEADRNGLPGPIALLLEKQLLSGLRDRVALYKDLPVAGRA